MNRKPSFSWRKWRLGLVVAIACGLLSAGAGVMAGMKWQAFIAVLSTSLLTHLVTYLKDHPIENIEDTTITKKEDL